MDPITLNIVIGLGTTVLGVFLALLIDRSRMPRIAIILTEKANDDITYKQGPVKDQRWKYFRVSVRNKKMPNLLKWLVRQTAENCRASITITGINNTTNFTYKGRWASTPELPYYRDSAIIKIFDPDPVTILAGESEILDVITKHEKDQEAYGWNNESYFNEWRTPTRRLDCGNYRIKITVTTQNGTSSIKSFFLVVGNTIEQTY